jgi:hypothetical protein
VEHVFLVTHAPCASPVHMWDLDVYRCILVHAVNLKKIILLKLHEVAAKAKGLTCSAGINADVYTCCK